MRFSGRRYAPPENDGDYPGSALRDHRLIDLRLEADDRLALAEVEHRALDHRGLGEHQRDGLAGIEPLLLIVGQRAEGRAGAVQHGLPAMFLDPALERDLVDPVSLVIVEAVGRAMAVEPAARLLHRVAVLDAVDGDSHVERLKPAASGCRGR